MISEFKKNVQIHKNIIHGLGKRKSVRCICIRRHKMFHT